MREASDQEVVDVLAALRPGRMGADIMRYPAHLARWPWHASEVEGSYAAAFALAALNALLRESERLSFRTAGAVSAALWKCMYAMLKGLAISRASSSRMRGCIATCLDALARVKRGDVYNRDGHNRYLSREDAVGFVQQVGKDGDPVPAAYARKMNALLFGWAEAGTFCDHTNHQECHGPYEGPDGRSWYVYSYRDLNATPGALRSGLRLPFDRGVVLVEWRGVYQQLDVFNNCLNGPDVEQDSISGEAVFLLEDVSGSRIRDVDVRALGTCVRSQAAWSESASYEEQSFMMRDACWARVPALLEIEKPKGSVVRAERVGIDQIEAYLQTAVAM